jgi:deoxyribonuclease V
MGRAWPGSADELEREQQELAARAWPAPLEGPPRLLAGCFVCFPRGPTGRGAAGDPSWAAAALVRGGRLAGDSVVAGEAGAPYEPGLLALREGPLLEAAVRELPEPPDLLLVDATARDHPRGFGLAAHVGAILELPTAGVTHRPLMAEGAWPGEERGAASPLVLDGRQVGCWLRTLADARPLAVHPGWRVTLDRAVAVVLDSTHRTRTPEPLRQARRLARVARAEAGA